MTAKEKIIMRLASVNQALPLHALDIPGVSQTAASARLREMARDGIAVSVPVVGKRYTAWTLSDSKAKDRQEAAEERYDKEVMEGGL